jgi:hypothetical protein
MFKPNLGKPSVNVILPDKEIVTYQVYHYANNNWWLIISDNQYANPRTDLHKILNLHSGPMTTDHLLGLTKFFPISWNYDLKSQIENVYSKLKMLVIFS